APLFDALADDRIHPDEALPDTGIGLERERWLSAAFIRGAEYGTRASTVVLLARDGGGLIVERRWGPMGAALGETRMELASQPSQGRAPARLDRDHTRSVATARRR